MINTCSRYYVIEGSWTGLTDEQIAAIIQQQDYEASCATYEDAMRDALDVAIHGEDPDSTIYIIHPDGYAEDVTDNF